MRGSARDCSTNCLKIYHSSGQVRWREAGGLKSVPMLPKDVDSFLPNPFILVIPRLCPTTGTVNSFARRSPRQSQEFLESAFTLVRYKELVAKPSMDCKLQMRSWFIGLNDSYFRESRVLVQAASHGSVRYANKFVESNFRGLMSEFGKEFDNASDRSPHLISFIWIKARIIYNILK